MRHAQRGAAAGQPARGATLSETAAIELRELLLAAGRRGRVAGGTEAIGTGPEMGSRVAAPAVPLGVETAAAPAVDRTDAKRQKEEAECKPKPQNWRK